jgi:hypothetical protein
MRLLLSCCCPLPGRLLREAQRLSDEPTVEIAAAALPEHGAIALLAALDDRLAAALKSCAIKLVCADFIRSDDGLESRLQRRQDLEELERSAGLRVFLPPDEAVAALRANNRAIGALTYCWASPDHPKADLAAIRRFLRSVMGAHVRAIFWDYASLFQLPRSPTQNSTFIDALSVMGDLCTPLRIYIKRLALSRCGTHATRALYAH